MSHENVYNKLIENQLVGLAEPQEPINKKRLWLRVPLNYCQLSEMGKVNGKKLLLSELNYGAQQRDP